MVETKAMVAVMFMVTFTEHEVSVTLPLKWLTSCFVLLACLTVEPCITSSKLKNHLHILQCVVFRQERPYR